MLDKPTISDIHAAAARIRPFIHRTPVLTCSAIDASIDANLFFKCENLQKVGAFKFRGASNAVNSLSEADLQQGVATHSSGNHGAALALAARLRGSHATVVMPNNASRAKIAAVRHYGAEIVFCETNDRSRQQALARLVEQQGYNFIHPFEDPHIIAGQGTAALELVEQVPDLDYLLVPVGGGGLLSGTAIVGRSQSRPIPVVGAEPMGADDAYHAFRAGKIVAVESSGTIADGLRAGLGQLTFSIIKDQVDHLVRASESSIVDAMRFMWERMKLVVEPSAAVPLAALTEQPERYAGKRIGVIISGGNIDLDALPWS